MNTNIILASRSSIRSQVLNNAGVAHTVSPADVDERAIEAGMRGAGAERVAAALAEAKALAVSRTGAARGALVIGADQVVERDGALLGKPASLAEARARLAALAGRPHRLVSAAALARDGAAIWSDAEATVVTMRPYDDAELDRHLERGAEAALRSSAGYEIEGLGARLIARIDGDFFTGLGLPLFPLLDALRREDAL
ncbi:MAG: Maf family protein [Pseudomonadota bacterium]